MTVSDLIRYFGDGDMFPDPKQEVKFTLCPDGASPSAMLDIRSTTVPEEGDAVVELRPAQKKKFRFSLKFEASPVIEAHTAEEAAEKACDMMRGVSIMRRATAGLLGEDPKFEALPPCFLEEVEE